MIDTTKLTDHEVEALLDALTEYTDNLSNFIEEEDEPENCNDRLKAKLATARSLLDSVEKAHINRTLGVEVP